jgi:hypothetical protein
MLLSCLVLCISCFSPFFTQPKSGLLSKATFYSSAAKTVDAANDLGDLEDDADQTSDGDSDLIDDVQMQPIELVTTIFLNSGFPLLNDQMLPKHFGELMVPPPQIGA